MRYGEDLSYRFLDIKHFQFFIFIIMVYTWTSCFLLWTTPPGGSASSVSMTMPWKEKLAKQKARQTAYWARQQNREITRTSGSGGAVTPNGQYAKVIRKGELKLTKSNSNNYQSWADGMEILLSAKLMWPSVMETGRLPEPSSRVDYMDWLADDAQTKAWIYVNLKNSQHNQLKDSSPHMTRGRH